MSVEVNIVCDACAEIIAAARTARKARAENRLRGGISRPPHDWCARCVSQDEHEHGVLPNKRKDSNA